MQKVSYLMQGLVARDVHAAAAAGSDLDLQSPRAVQRRVPLPVRHREHRTGHVCLLPALHLQRGGKHSYNELCQRRLTLISFLFVVQLSVRHAA